MNYTWPRHLIFASTLILLTALRTTFAQELHPDELQDEPWVKEVVCRGDQNRERRGFIGDREFRFCFLFSEDKLQPTLEGTPNYSDLYITSYTKKGQPNLTTIDVVRLFPEEHPGLILGDANPLGPERSSELSSARFFKVHLQVTNQARSGRYPIALKLTSGTETAEQKIDFSLPVLATNNPSIVVKPKRHSVVDCWAGSDCSSLDLEVQNKLPYRIKITNISVSSGDLLQNQPAGEYAKEFESNSPPRDLSLVMRAKPVTFRRVFSGFGTPQLSLRIDYKDEYGRFLSTESPADLEIRPNILVIILFLILGAVIGTFVRVDLAKLQRAGLITKTQRVVFVITTFVSGIVVCLIALFANIKIIVWSNDNSYSAWDPKVLFLTALIATVSGLPILYAYLKLARPADAPAPPPSTNSPETNN